MNRRVDIVDKNPFVSLFAQVNSSVHKLTLFQIHFYALFNWHFMCKCKKNTQKHFTALKLPLLNNERMAFRERRRVATPLRRPTTNLHQRRELAKTHPEKL